MSLIDGINATDRAMMPTGIVALHQNGSVCNEVTTRRRVYVDGISYLVTEGRFGGVSIQPPPSADPPAAEVDPGADDLEMYWTLISTAMADEIRWLKDGDFLTINYETGDPDYALYGQLAPEEESFHIEVVSNQFMPADDWPLDAEYLQQADWSPPDEECPNWSLVQNGAEAAADSLLLALRHGRGCLDPRRFDWHPAMFLPQTDD
ncbi:TY-Chap domain-containing protein [Arthrobacter psychrolactophilus]